MRERERGNKKRGGSHPSVVVAISLLLAAAAMAEASPPILRLGTDCSGVGAACMALAMLGIPFLPWRIDGRPGATLAELWRGGAGMFHDSRVGW